MPESRNTSLMELSSRYAAGGAESVIQRYPDTKDFLIVPPAGTKQPPLQWTSSISTLVGGTTDLCSEEREKLLSVYSDPRTIITPLAKRGRNKDSNIIVGRSDCADIRFTEKSVSKQHARIKLDGNKVFIRDLESTNGTFINDCQLLTESNYQVSPGQEIKFAETRTVYINLEYLLDLVKLATKR